MKRIIPIFLFILILLPINVFAKGKGVAKVLIMRGKVHYKKGPKVITLKKGMWLPEGAMIKTSKRSFAKFLFIDKSSMNLGPNSQIKIETFPKNKAGIITLMKGQLRSKVTKNYMEIKNKKNSKLFIKTRSAAMGVRGTEFQVNYNPQNNATSLITFSGAVAMVQLENRIRRMDQRVLERAVSGNQAVIVRKGQFSGSNPKQNRVTIPVKISPNQLEVLKSTNPFNAKNSKEKKSALKQNKNFRSVVPPGVDAKAVSNTTFEGKVSATDTVPAEGMFNAATGALAPKAGGYLDLGTAQYIPPPEGSSFDASTNTYTPPPSAGEVNPIDGGYVNMYYQIQPDGQFEKITQDDGPTIKDGRAPASIDDAPPPPPSTDLATGQEFNPDFQVLDGGANATFVNTDEFLEDVALEHEDFLNSPDQNTRTKVNFDINVQ